MDFNILGVGLPELIVILVIMLVVAGPKRMIVWAYQLGIWVQKFRRIFDETVAAFRKELEASDIELPKELTNVSRGRFDIVQEANKLINTELSQPASPASSGSTGSTSADSGATATSSEQEPSPNAQSDDEKPRYDSWLPKQ